MHGLGSSRSPGRGQPRAEGAGRWEDRRREKSMRISVAPRANLGRTLRSCGTTESVGAAKVGELLVVVYLPIFL